MAIQTPDEIDFSTFPTSDGQPMAETFVNQLQMTDLIHALETLLAQQGRTEVTVGGNQLIYYNPANGWDHVSPDVYVVFDVAMLAPPKWETWVQGKFPDVVFEITSSSTRAQDQSERPPKGKRWLYAQLGAREYYIYDPQGETHPPFVGYELRAGRYEPLPQLPSGGIRSPLLGAELRPVAAGAMRWRPAAVWLRVIDPATEQPIPVADEDRDALQAAEQMLHTTEQTLHVTEERLSEEAQARLAAEQQAAREAQARLVAEQQAAGEAQARLAAEQARREAEERAARAEAALRAVLADAARRQSQEGVSEDEYEHE